MDFKLLAIKHAYLSTDYYEVELSATHYELDQTQSDHFAHFTIKIPISEADTLTVRQIEARAIEQAKKMLFP